MALRPIDVDLLEDLCRDIALEHSGFLYVNKVKDDIRSTYENSETGLLNADSVSARDINETLDEIAGDEFTEFERLRTGVYFFDPFPSGNEGDITADLTNLFGQRLVVTSEELRSRFDIAFDDIDMFVDKLVSKDLVRRIAAGERDYFTIGPRLKEETGEAGVDARLRQKATHGKISHDQLERVINVEATQDVIRYLETQGFIVDLDGEYLVESTIDDFGVYLADQIVADVEGEFEDWNYVLPEDEFDQVVRNAIKEWTDVLGNAGAASHEIVTETKNALKDRLTLEDRGSMVVKRDALDDFVERRIVEVRTEVVEEHEHLSSEEDFTEAGEARISEMQLTTSAKANEFLQDELKRNYRQLIEDDFST